MDLVSQPVISSKILPGKALVDRFKESPWSTSSSACATLFLSTDFSAMFFQHPSIKVFVHSVSRTCILSAIVVNAQEISSVVYFSRRDIGLETWQKVS